MRRVSEKMSRRIAECREFRDQLKAEVGHCELCGHDPTRVRPGMIQWALHVHEIARGPDRDKAQDQRCATLVLCSLCHNEVDDTKAWPYARQLAALKQSRPQDYDLEAFNALVGRAWLRVREEDVERFS